MKYTVSLFVVLSLAWLGNSGFFTPLLLGFGLVSVVFVILVTRRMDVVDEESQPLHLMRGRLLGYYLWLLGSIVRSNIDVVWRIWRGNGAISPTVATLTMTQGTDMGKVIYANSITLTPGTVALDVTGNTVTVHSLTREGIDDLLKGDMGRRVADVERGR